jgi:hypothetical protein
MTVPTTIVSQPSVDIAHHRIHEGNHFTVHKITLAVPVAPPKYFLIIPPPVQPDGSIIEMHLIYEIDSDVGGTLEFFENPTVASNGTPLTIVNNNRRSSTLSLCQVFENPIVTSDGTSIFQERLGNTTTPIELGEFERNEEETVLHQVDKYALKFVPLAVANITMELSWYDNRPSSPVPILP